MRRRKLEALRRQGVDVPLDDETTTPPPGATEQPSSNSDLSDGMSWVNFHFVFDFFTRLSECAQATLADDDGAGIDIWSTMLVTGGCTVAAFIMRELVDRFIIPYYYLQYKKEEEVPIDSHLPFPSWELKIFEMEFLGIAEAAGFAIGSNCQEFMVTAYVALVILFLPLFLLAYIIHLGTLHYCRYEAREESIMEVFREAFRSTDEDGNPKEKGLAGRLFAAFGEIRESGEWVDIDDDEDEDEDEDGSSDGTRSEFSRQSSVANEGIRWNCIGHVFERNGWEMKSFLGRFGLLFDGFNDKAWWYGVWSMMIAVIIGMSVALITDGESSSDTVFSIYVVDLFFKVVFQPNADLIELVQELSTAGIETAQLGCVLVYVKGLVSPDWLSQAFVVFSIFGFIPSLIGTITSSLDVVTQYVFQGTSYLYAQGFTFSAIFGACGISFAGGNVPGGGGGKMNKKMINIFKENFEVKGGGVKQMRKKFRRMKRSCKCCGLLTCCCPGASSSDESSDYSDDYSDDGHYDERHGQSISASLVSGSGVHSMMSAYGPKRTNSAPAHFAQIRSASISTSASLLYSGQGGATSDVYMNAGQPSIMISFAQDDRKLTPVVHGGRQSNIRGDGRFTEIRLQRRVSTSASLEYANSDEILPPLPGDEVRRPKAGRGRRFSMPALLESQALSKLPKLGSEEDSLPPLPGMDELPALPRHRASSRSSRQPGSGYVPLRPGAIEALPRLPESEALPNLPGRGSEVPNLPGRGSRGSEALPRLPQSEALPNLPGKRSRGSEALPSLPTRHRGDDAFGNGGEALPPLPQSQHQKPGAVRRGSAIEQWKVPSRGPPPVSSPPGNGSEALPRLPGSDGPGGRRLHAPPSPSEGLQALPPSRKGGVREPHSIALLPAGVENKKSRSRLGGWNWNIFKKREITTGDVVRRRKSSMAYHSTNLELHPSMQLPKALEMGGEYGMPPLPQPSVSSSRRPGPGAEPQGLPSLPQPGGPPSRSSRSSRARGGGTSKLSSWFGFGKREGADMLPPQPKLPPVVQSRRTAKVVLEDGDLPALPSSSNARSMARSATAADDDDLPALPSSSTGFSSRRV